MKCATKKDIQDLLEVLNTTSDIEIQSKIFSLFGCYLVSNNSSNSDLIITSHFVYEKIYAMLSKGLPKKITVTLNFVSALLLHAEEDSCSTRQSLVLHAQHMLRVSGCLAVMSNFFNSCMVHQETWTALCRCLSEVCRLSQDNQNYCSDLITTGIRRCASGDTECYQVLQSLLKKHDRNTQQFIDSNGLAIFTRDKLHNISCLKLVNEISQNPKAVILLVHKTDVIEILRIFLKLYGQESLIGQWATVVLYNITTLIKDIDEHETKETEERGDYRFCVENISNMETLVNGFKKEKRKETETNFDSRVFMNNENTNKNGDTTELFKNIFREMMQSQKDGVNVYNVAPGSRNRDTRQNSEKSGNTNTIRQTIKSSKVLSVPSVENRANITKSMNQNRPVITPNKNNLNVSLRHSRADLSFSFLLNENFSLNRNRNSRLPQQFGVVSFNISDKEKSSIVTHTSVDVRQGTGNNKVTRHCYNVTKLIENMEDNTDRTLEFKPNIASTPKRLATKKLRNYSIKNKTEERTIRHGTFKHRKAPNKEIKNKSFSGKLFGAINDSCTMLVKTVKNIFSTKNTENNTRTKEEYSLIVKSSTRKAHSNYSFMDYMRRRDAIMGSRCGDLSSEKKSSGSCETCNDTILLKRKLEKDYKLKQTLKKLKFGINLYGCDFKKISATMWPRDTYMTPTVLYNLYRKLIVK